VIFRIILRGGTRPGEALVSTRPVSLWRSPEGDVYAPEDGAKLRRVGRHTIELELEHRPDLIGVEWETRQTGHTWVPGVLSRWGLRLPA
jgi:hypothetical protein